MNLSQEMINILMKMTANKLIQSSKGTKNTIPNFIRDDRLLVN